MPTLSGDVRQVHIGAAYINMFTVQELTDAVQAYKPIEPATKKGWSYGIRGFENKPVAEIDKKFVVMRRVELNRLGYKQGYVRTLLGYCGTIWSWAKEMDLVTDNPWEGSLKGLSKGKKSYPFLPFEHYKQLHNDPLFMCVWYHGFRANEIAVYYRSVFGFATSRGLLRTSKVELRFFDESLKNFNRSDFTLQTYILLVF